VNAAAGRVGRVSVAWLGAGLSLCTKTLIGNVL